MTDTRIKPSITTIPDDLYMADETTADEQAYSSGDEVGRDYIPTVNLRQSWWKPLTEDRPATPKPAWTIPSSDLTMPTNNWASALRITHLTLQDLEGPAFEIVKAFHPDMIHLQLQMEECHKLLTDQVDDTILRRPFNLEDDKGGHIFPGCRLGATGGFKDNDSTFTDSHLKETAEQKLLVFFMLSVTRVEDFQLGIESYQTQLNLTKPRWEATGFEFKHDFTVIEARAVIFRDRYGVQMIMRFNEIHKFSDGTLQQIDEALDYRVKESGSTG
ncbi:hypothetical protein Tco_0162201 [Tanacetum coccineum]